MASGAAGPIDAGIVVRRTIKGAEMTAFWVALRGLCALSTIHTDNMDILSWLHRGEKEVHWPESEEEEEEDLRIKIREDMRKVRDKDIGLGAKPVKANRTKKETAKITLFEKFVVEGNEAAAWLAKEEADLDGGVQGTITTATVEQERMEVYAALQHAATFHDQAVTRHDCEELKPKPKQQWPFVDKQK